MVKTCALAANLLRRARYPRLPLALGAGVFLLSQSVSSQATPPTDRYVGTYDWRTRHFDETFGDKYEFVNNCDQPVTLTFDNHNVPFLLVMPRVDVKPGKNEIPVTLTTPAWPDVPQCIDLKGTWVVESTGYEAGDAVCHPSITTYSVSAHVHWWDRAPPPPKLRAAVPDACRVWWNTGQRPNATDAECLEPIRRLAAEYRKWIEPALAGRPAYEWSWLPSAVQMASMSIEELLLVKAKADALLRVTP